MSSDSNWQAKQRAKIQRAKVVELFIDHALNPGANPLTSSQFKVGCFLLKRALPELRSVEHQGKIDSKIEVVISVED